MSDRFIVTREDYQALVQAEMDRQVEKWGEQRHWDHEWLAIVMEELGEVAKAIVEGKPKEMREEMIQLAALIETWYRDTGRPRVVIDGKVVE